MDIAFTFFLRAGSESVRVVETRYDHYPAVFEWGGRSFEVKAVRRFWTGVRYSLAGQATELHHFHVTTVEDDFVLTHDVRRDRWEVSRAKDADGRAAA